MPIYCEPYSDEKLLADIEINEKVLFIGCGSCANISYNLLSGAERPAFTLRKTPLSMLEEIKRLKNLLSENKTDPKSIIINGLCVNTKSRMEKLKKKGTDCDKIIVLSCKAGLETVETALKDKNVCIGMRIRGFKSLKFKRKGTKIYINKDERESIK